MSINESHNVPEDFLVFIGWTCYL